MMFFSKKYSLFIVMTGLLIVMTLVALLGIFPLKRAIIGKMDDLQRIYTSRENRERQISRLPELEGQFQEIVAGEEAIDILLPEERIVDFIRTLEDLARETGTEITIESKEGNAIVEKKPAKISAPAKANSTDAAEGGATAPAGKKVSVSIADTLPFDRYLHINVSLRGGYSGIIMFLHKMETLPFGLDVIGMEISIDEDDGSAKSGASSMVGIASSPFMVVAGNSMNQPVSSSGASEKSLKAVFDTVVYIDK